MYYRCRTSRRRAAVWDQKEIDGKLLNGFDYLEVSPDQTALILHFIHNLPGQDGGTPAGTKPLNADNFVIQGGVRIIDIGVKSVECTGNIAILKVSTPGDFSIYRLCLVKSPAELIVPQGFDPQLSYMDFSFKVECSSRRDIKSIGRSSVERYTEPRIDYLAKDYSSFRRLMLDRLSETIPDWKERNPSDLGIALVELLAYVGDHLSYYQDAVATEAYLGTARKRCSLCRHARLLDYNVDEGCNARVWVCFEVDRGPPIFLRKEGDRKEHRIRLLTRCVKQRVIEPSQYREVINSYHPEVFELMHDLTLYPQHSHISFYTWSEQLCCLPAGSTCATLYSDPKNPLLLRPGDVLILEELKGIDTGLEEDADPSKRNPVRLIRVDPQAEVDPQNSHDRLPGKPKKDPLTGQEIVEIEWHSKDALPFSLCISKRIGGKILTDMSCARGNVALADHGLTLEDEELSPSAVPSSGSYHPKLKRKDITFSAAYDHEKALSMSASSAISQKSHQAFPAVQLKGDGDLWEARRDLLSCDRFSPYFVVEMDEDRAAHLRFGDDVQGRRPTPGILFKANYRIGSGTKGNVGAEALAHVVPVEGAPIDQLQILKIRNPLPALGGTDAEPTSQISLHAPPRFRSQLRAITEEDYARAALQHPEVMNAQATLRWTGSWHTMFVTVDRKRGHPIDLEFEEELRNFLEPYRMAGHDLEIDGPVLVPLNIALAVNVEPGYLASDVKRALMEIFSNADLPGGQRGYFHPDNFTFQQPVYLSHLVNVAMNVPGVVRVEPQRFQRWGRPARDEIEQGMIVMERLEIATLDNDPSFPENGRIDFIMQGGLQEF